MFAQHHVFRAQPNQQALPALQWAESKGYKKIFLIGSDYVYPRTANLILKKHIAHDGLTLSGEEYVPLGGTDFSSIVAEIQKAQPDIIINTLNGDSNVSFFKQMAAAGLTPDKLPVMSFSIAEPAGGQLYELELFPEPARADECRFRGGLQGEVRCGFGGG